MTILTQATGPVTRADLMNAFEAVPSMGLVSTCRWGVTCCLGSKSRVFSAYDSAYDFEIPWVEVLSP